MVCPGLLDGYRATTNRRAFDWVVQRSDRVVWQPRTRWVVDRVRRTSSGIAAGIDMAHALISSLAGAETADQIVDDVEVRNHRDPRDDPFAATC